MTGKKIKIEVEPVGKRLILDKPENALQALLDAGIELKSVCGGKGTCGKCRIIIMENSAPGPTEQEFQALSKDEVSHGVRLACQQVLSKDTNLYVPASSFTEEQKLQVTGAEAEIKVEQLFKKYYLILDPPTLLDMESDFSRIKRSLLDNYKVEVKCIDFKVLSGMAEILRSNSWKITATVRNGEIVFIEPADRTGFAYGVAIDLGTTKIATLLVDLNTGKTIGKKGTMNPQINFGEDVMSRINFAMQGSQNLQKIQRVVIEQINKTIGELVLECNVSREEIIELTLVGNTAMHHLILGLPVRQLGLAPFVALTDKPLEIKARELGIDISSGAYIYLMPVIAGFVGSDHLAMVLASGIDDEDRNVLGIDIGTNTEIVLKTGKSMESVSTASGPAFEGAHIRFGMRAANGAIERVTIDPETCVPKIQTIGDKKPIGICGSGILDGIAELLKAKIINTRGRFQQDSGCLCIDNRGDYQYMLDGKISINQKDIVEVQLAKSAIRTGIEILLENAGIDFGDIDKIIVAGAFGSYIDPKNVVDIGMFPRVSLKKIIQVGNAAAIGAKMVLISRSLRKKAEDISEKINYLELTVFPTFSDHFAKSTLFPELS